MTSVFQTKHIIHRIIGFLALMAMSAPTYSQIPGSFGSAKTKLYKTVYPNFGQTFYAGCSWKNKKIDLTSCNLQDSFPKTLNKRSKRGEAEHVVPIKRAYKKNGVKRQCVINAEAQGQRKRSYCQATDKEFRNAHNDLVNLRVAVGAINLYRLDKPFAEALSGEKRRVYHGNGKVFKVSSRVAVPDDSIKGDVARIAMYMNWKYGIDFNAREQAMYLKWHELDPVSDEERELNRRIIKAQGNGNPYVE